MKISNYIKKIISRTGVAAALGGLLVATSALSAVGALPQQPFTVVIDAGHGGHDTGAVDNGVKEKDINLGVAKKLASIIDKKMKGAKVVMTRADDKFISLQERANIANRNRGDLFVSIHTNSVDKKNPNRKSVSGASVYALGLHKDAANQQVARRENSVIELESNYEQKYAGFDPSKDESYIIFEMAQKRNLGQSLKFANQAQKELVATASRADRGVKQAGFWVLWATSMPSVLVELDFICNPKSANFMGSEEGQEQLATALFNAVKEYAAHRPKPQGAVIDNPRTTDKGSGNAKENKKNNSKKNKKNKKDNKKNKGSETENTTATVSAPETDGVPVLAAVTPRASRRVTAAPAQNNGRSVNYAQARSRSAAPGHRKRRSENARTASINREIDSKNITLKSENDYLARVETKAPQKVETQPDPKPESASKKGSKKKNSKASKNSQDSKSTKSTKSSNSSKQKNNTRKIIVTTKKHTSLAGRRASAENNSASNTQN